MCGINGRIGLNIENSDSLERVREMNGALVHRGPNSDGFYNDEYVTLGMRRLSIIDIEGGSQPLFNEDKTVILICNGEIYNHIELRKKLESCGHTFYTRSDCETVIHAYEEYGEDFLNQIRGMFALCIYDKKLKRVIIARDRMGEKPIYFTNQDGKMFFSSELKALTKIISKDELRASLDNQSILEYFYFGYIPEPNTLFTSISKVRPGEYICYDLIANEYRKETYWSTEHIEPKSANQNGIRETLEDIGSIIVRSDVPVGVALSGGIDSSIVAILANKYSPRHIQAFSIGYSDNHENDEREDARLLAKKLNMPFHSVEINKKYFVSNFEKMIEAFDEPISDIAAYNYFVLAKSCKDAQVPVLLVGFGGDELFWGYQWVVNAIEKNVMKRTWFGKIKLMLILIIESRRGVYRKPLEYLSYILNIIFGSRVALYEFTTDWRRTHLDKKELFTKSFINTTKSIYSRLYKPIKQESISVEVNRQLINTWLVSNCIDLGDRMSMAHSIELRLPLVDHMLVEKVIANGKYAPHDYKKGFKSLLIDACLDILPADIAKRKKKGFSPPSQEWRSEISSLYRNIVIDGLLVRGGIINISYIEKAYAKKDDFFIYKAILLELGLQKYIK